MRLFNNLPPHVRIFSVFFFYSVGIGGIYPRVGDIQLQMGVAEGALGLSLIGTAIGTLISLTFAAPLVERIGHRATIRFLIPAMTVFFALASFAQTPVAFFFSLLPVGLCVGAVELVINVEADRTESLIGRRIMSRCHAFWSFGFFVSGLFGAFCKQAGISPQAQLIATVFIVTATIWLVGHRFAPAPHRAGGSTDATPRFARPSLPILVLVIMTLSAMVLEGAGADWSAIYMRNVFSVAPFLAGFAVALGALTQAAARFFADGFVERHGPRAVARALFLTLGTGVLLVTFSFHPAVSLLGFAMMGVGTSAIFPLAMSAAAQRTDRPAAINVAALAQLSFVAFLFGPPLLGSVAEHFGIRASFGICIPLVLVSLMTLPALAQRKGDTVAAHG